MLRLSLPVVPRLFTLPPFLAICRCHEYLWRPGATSGIVGALMGAQLSILVLDMYIAYIYSKLILCLLCVCVCVCVCVCARARARGCGGCVGVWVCGCVGVWVCGCVGVWVCGCVGVWVCGCVGVWV
jgi:hypothetical protein